MIQISGHDGFFVKYETPAGSGALFNVAVGVLAGGTEVLSWRFLNRCRSCHFLSSVGLHHFLPGLTLAKSTALWCGSWQFALTSVSRIYYWCFCLLWRYCYAVWLLRHNSAVTSTQRYWLGLGSVAVWPVWIFIALALIWSISERVCRQYRYPVLSSCLFWFLLMLSFWVVWFCLAVFIQLYMDLKEMADVYANVFHHPFCRCPAEETVTSHPF